MLFFWDILIWSKVLSVYCVYGVRNSGKWALYVQIEKKLCIVLIEGDF